MFLARKKTAHNHLTPVHTSSCSCGQAQAFHPFYWDNVKHPDTARPLAEVRQRRASPAELAEITSAVLVSRGTFIRMVLAGTSLYEICRLTGLTQGETHAMANSLGLWQRLYKNTYRSA